MTSGWSQPYAAAAAAALMTACGCCWLVSAPHRSSHCHCWVLQKLPLLLVLLHLCLPTCPASGPCLPQQTAAGCGTHLHTPKHNSGQHERHADSSTTAHRAGPLCCHCNNGPCRTRELAVHAQQMQSTHCNGALLSCQSLSHPHSPSCWCSQPFASCSCATCCCSCRSCSSTSLPVLLPPPLLAPLLLLVCGRPPLDAAAVAAARLSVSALSLARSLSCTS